MNFLPISLVGVFSLAIASLTGCDSSENPARSSYPALSESHVGRFMAECLPTHPSATCVCLLENFGKSARAEVSVGQVTAAHVRELFQRHSMQCQRANVSMDKVAKASESATTGQPLPTREPASAIAQAQPTTPASPATRAPIVGLPERAATDVETCVQTEVVRRSLEEPDGTVTMTEFDAIRKKCGGG
jgi:hypothetical protein